MEAVRNKIMEHRLLSGKSLIAAYILFSSVVPFFALVYEFGFERGWFLTSLYGHIFIYPVVFGFWMVIFLVKALKQLTSIQETQQAKKYLGILLVLAFLGGSYAEFSEKSAIFEVKGSELSASLKASHGSTTITFIKYIATDNPNKKMYGEAFDKKVPSSTFSNFPSMTIPQIAYVISFSLQLIVWLLVLLSFMWSFRLFLLRSEGYLKSREEIILYLLKVLIFAIPWVAWRLSFENYREAIYPEVVVEHAAALLGVPFIVAGIYLAILSWKQYGSRIEPIISLASSIGVGSLLISEGWLREVFPKAPEPQHFIILFVIVMMLVVPILIPGHSGSRNE